LNDAKEKLVISIRHIVASHAWAELEKKQQAGEIFEAKVTDAVKGGLVVSVGVRGFIPASMVDRQFIEDLSVYKGKTLRVIIKELDRENNKVILSAKEVLEAESKQVREKRLAEIKEGDVLTGTVRRVTAFGAFIDLGGVEGLVHISELAWDRVQETSSVVKEGEIVTVKVLKVELEKGRIGLSMKAVQASPWQIAQEKLQVGAIVEGTVKRLTTFGAFVEIAAGVDGLVHISQISHKRIATPQEVLKVNQVVSVKIMEINVQEQRISLSIKETEEAPVVDVVEKAQSVVEVEVIDPKLLEQQDLNISLGDRFGDTFAKLNELTAEQPKKKTTRTKKADTE
jgi:small subunit ribosomal protein S1